jgi:hypothetical protein
MAVISGKDGSANGTQVTSWSFNPTSNNPAFATEDTNGWKDRVAGIKDGSGSVEGKWDAAASFTAGAEVTMVLSDGTNSYSFQAFIDTFSVEVNADDGEPVSWTADFSTSGAY